MRSTSYSKLIVFLFSALIFASCVSQRGTVVRKQKTVQHEVIDYGKKHLHKPYRYAGKGPSSFDCSGFTSFVFKEFGYNLNPSSAGQAQQGQAIERKEELEVGDLVFFEGRSHNRRVGHVGIVSDVKRNGKFKFLHASTNHGVIISSSEEPYYKSRYLRGGRILTDTKPVREEKQKTQQTQNILLAQQSNIKTNQSEATNEYSSQKTNNKPQNNFTKAKKQTTTHVRGDDGTVTIHTRSVEDPAVESTQPLKPTNTKEPEEEKSNNKEEIRQSAIRVSEESTLPSPISTTHIVKPGETFFSISKKHGISVKQLQRWNPKVKDNVIYAGDKLNVYQ